MSRALFIPREQAAVVGANIRALRRAYGWTQAQLAGKMGWASASTVCAAEGHRDRTQRNFTPAEVDQLAGIFDRETVGTHQSLRALQGEPACRVHLSDLRESCLGDIRRSKKQE
jgi:transcriptional regulator with XRE-family HTH domain